MSQYLEEAARLLRKAAEDNERSSHYSDGSGPLNPGRERIAMKFAQLGAIEHGLIPAEMVSDLLACIARGDRPTEGR